MEISEIIIRQERRKAVNQDDRQGYREIEFLLNKITQMRILAKKMTGLVIEPPECCCHFMEDGRIEADHACPYHGFDLI